MTPYKNKMFSSMVITPLICIFLLNACDKGPPDKAIEKIAESTAKIETQNQASNQKIDLEPWLQANIDWKQHNGANLSILAAGHSGFPPLKPLLPIFEALTGIKVGYLMADEGDMRSKRKTDLSSGAGIYDVVSIGVTYLGEANAGGWLEDLNPYLNDTSLTDLQWYQKDDIGKAFMDLQVKDNKLLGMPYSIATGIFWYRKDLFDKYDIKVPDSYEDVVVMKEKLQKAMDQDGLKDIYAFAARAKMGAGLNTWMVIPTIRAYGGEMLDENGYAIFNSPEAVKALEIYRDMITGIGTPPDSESLFFYDMRKLFVEGKLASLIVGSDFFNQLNGPEMSPVWDKWDAAITPRGPASRAASPWAWSWSINSGSSNKTAAWLFVQWATSEATIKTLGTGITPARFSAWESKTFEELNAPGLLTAARWSLENASPSRMQLGIPEFPEAGKVASQAFSEIFFGAPVQETLDAANAKVDVIMTNGPTRKQMADQ